MTGRRFAWQRFSRDAGGAAAVEFALVSVAFFSLLFGIIFLAIFLYTNATLQWAISRAARLPEIDAAVSQSQITQAIDKDLSTAGITDASVTYSVSQSGGATIGTISASFDRTYSVPLIDTFNLHYSATTSVPLAS
ncbi:MAG: pilus assembly protein [Alphaproteobacteria bacterium]|nr:pilus assembly protein [Alphaproteobacteria bacterium]MDE2073499.1 pilus assembly protein [Alphaproteobacteria bacterium]